MFATVVWVCALASLCGAALGFSLRVLTWARTQDAEHMRQLQRQLEEAEQTLRDATRIFHNIAEQAHKKLADELLLRSAKLDTTDAGGTR